MSTARFAVAAVLTGLIGLTGLTGCNLDDTSVSSTGATAAPGGAAAAGGASQGAKQAQYGEVLQVSKGGEVAATVSVAAPKAVPSFFSGFSKPTSGPAFATFMVSFTSAKAGFAVNPFDFFVRTPDGARVQPTIGCEPAFNAATLGQGEKYQGCLTIDAAHGVLVYASGLFGATGLVEWPGF
ncbi:hypothetical protein CcI156_19330 [Frankia sp. CcI156]|jgi:hypothetical protein|uniref:Lipoprotein n=1 Tax=Frankia casuarinae (strain DSM 45818 / CECT 9043 / HFP020203 / CcI3) TaxID=106370 RepID=Q2J9F5_FRACC|nr:MULTISPECIES: hypothetical protein [Frankia]ABD12087.1 hypothetical protein Francci3_2727 [Frankia casuarinae]ETA00600.1 hypothetical protein CcI6DRAFT_03990 [Frankia sp. CcI6]EYT91870.1 hypothetical protein ThrDRAFT_02515 [Frankia casuarinae]KDA41310.1 hypothetical protein BMG523Draft_03853 [Frankia sp. BMG5.23]KEZ34851.1 hypothetical protein CEDDRAFT_03781 [Frankia sp. CeD]